MTQVYYDEKLLPLPEKETGTFSCPICGKDTPHYHLREETEPQAWVYEEAYSVSQQEGRSNIYDGWQRKLSWNIPERLTTDPYGIRNLRPLYFRLSAPITSQKP